MTQALRPKTSAPLLFHIAKFFYTVLYCCLLPILLVIFRRKLDHSAPELAARSFWERFGSVAKATTTGGIHIHCVSVGELNAANGLITTLLQDYPNKHITLTTSSTTGAVHAYTLFKDKVSHYYLPLDIPWFMTRFYNKIKPSLVLVTEVEVWPNMLHICTKRDIPVVLINARMSKKSLRNYQRFSLLFRHTFRRFSYICAQSSESFENFIAFGVYKNKLKLSRNMKFDLLPNAEDEHLGKQIAHSYGIGDRPVFLAASTHESEEKIALDTYKVLKNTYPDLFLIIVPRHPHRFDSVHQIIKATGYTVAKVTESYTASGESPLSSTEVGTIDCLLVDKMGWLKACYSVCRVAFVGGSFAPKGGHNALEAALYSKPIVMGPSTFNNPSICQYLASQNALVITTSPNKLTEAVQYWLDNPLDAANDGERGLRVLLKNVGSVEYTMGILRNFL